MRGPHLYNLAHAAQKPFNIFLIMILFAALSDGIASYLVPVLIVDTGASNTFMGVILGSSSIAGALFDYVLSKYLKKPHYRRIYFIMFALAFSFVIIMFHASTIWLYLVIMAIWGFYYDLVTFGNLDFISRVSQKSEYSTNMGLLNSFRSIGYLISPLIIGFIVGEVIDAKPFAMMFIFLLISFISFLILLKVVKNENEAQEILEQTTLNESEISVWKKLGSIITPVLIFDFVLLLSDAFFWTVGPLLAESLDSIHPYNGLIMAAYSLPPLYMGFFVGRFTQKWGKKRVAYIAFIIGSLVLSSLLFFQAPYIVMLVFLIASSMISLSLPALSSAYVDYIDEARTYEKEIEGLHDFFNNLGYVFGPICAGLLADLFGYHNTFAILGIFSALVVIILLKITPRSIDIRKGMSALEQEVG